MNTRKLLQYYFPNEETKKIKKLYFSTLKAVLGVENFVGNHNFTQHERITKRCNLEKTLVEYITNCGILQEFIFVYKLQKPHLLCEQIFEAIVVDELIKCGKSLTDIFLNKDSILYFDNKYPNGIDAILNGKEENILTECSLIQKISDIVNVRNFYI